MKNILCYGDSNTWGYRPGNAWTFALSAPGRYAPHERWPGVLRAELGEDYTVIEEGLPGRTTVFDDPLEQHRNGKTYLIPCLDTHSPLDLVVIMLGTNDLKQHFSLSAYEIATGAAILVGVVQSSGTGPDGSPPEVLLMSPPEVRDTGGDEASQLFDGAVRKSRQLAEYYRQVAAEYACGFLDTSQIITTSDEDGIHLGVHEHTELGIAVAGFVRAILG